MGDDFTLGPAWAEQYLNGLILLNALLGQPKSTAPITPPEPEAVLRTLTEIALGHYAPDRYFRDGERDRFPFLLDPPPIAESRSYRLIALRAVTPMSLVISTATGGIAFEDPAWAIFGAHAIAQGLNLGLPIAAGHADLYKGLGRLSTAIRDSRYRPGDFFGRFLRYTPPHNGPSFEYVDVPGSSLAALRRQGTQSFGTPSPKFYVLFQPPAPSR